jgi:hypothetical protein
MRRTTCVTVIVSVTLAVSVAALLVSRRSVEPADRQSDENGSRERQAGAVPPDNAMQTAGGIPDDGREAAPGSDAAISDWRALMIASDTVWWVKRDRYEKTLIERADGEFHIAFPAPIPKPEKESTNYAAVVCFDARTGRVLGTLTADKLAGVLPSGKKEEIKSDIDEMNYDSAVIMMARGIMNEANIPFSRKEKIQVERIGGKVRVFFPAYLPARDGETNYAAAVRVDARTGNVLQVRLSGYSAAYPGDTGDRALKRGGVAPETRVQESGAAVGDVQAIAAAQEAIGRTAFDRKREIHVERADGKIRVVFPAHLPEHRNDYWRGSQSSAEIYLDERTGSVLQVGGW